MSEQRHWLLLFSAVLHKSSQMMMVWEDEKATAVYTHHEKNLLYPKHLCSMWPYVRCICSGRIFGFHVRASELDECAYITLIRHHVIYTVVNTHNVPSISSLISSQHLVCYATSQEKRETNTTKLDERWNCSVQLSWNPAFDSLTVEWFQ